MSVIMFVSLPPIEISWDVHEQRPAAAWGMMACGGTIQQAKPVGRRCLGLWGWWLRPCKVQGQG